MRRRGGLAALTLLVLGVLAIELETQTPLKVSGAWVREPVPGRTITAAYAVVENPGTAPVRIVAVSADVAGTAEMHEMTRAGDVMKMAPVKDITVPAGGTVALEPGGLHLMLFELARPLKEGDTVALTFSMSDGRRVKAVAAVKKARM